jgi:uncharacterized membrane protein
VVAKLLNFTKTSIVLLLVTIFGMAFSGYLTYGVLSANTCPLNGGCTKVFGYPSCMYGFTMYTVMMIVVLLTLIEKVVFATGRKLVLIVSAVGMIFSGSLLVQEFLNSSPLTICAAGFSMFTLILVICTLVWKKD